MSLRALVVDDESMGRELLRHDLEAMDDVEVVGEAADGFEALTLAERLRPDVMFLDIDMPELTGIEVVGAMEGAPLVVFVTAHTEFAVEAFDLDATDYLTKPVRSERLAEAVERVRRALSRPAAGSDGAKGGEEPAPAERLNDALVGPDGRITRFIARAGSRIRLVRADALHWARAAGNYVELHTNEGIHLVRMTFGDLEGGLDPTHFRRIHRSHLVNLDRVVEVRSDGHGSWDVELRGGQVLRMSPSFRDRLLGSG
ncbi:MAG: LytTR family DNA-binding domain-containing protein [Gemmatimonadota bacterium]|jgi:two-component system LytT family response regulator